MPTDATLSRLSDADELARAPALGVHAFVSSAGSARHLGRCYACNQPRASALHGEQSAVAAGYDTPVPATAERPPFAYDPEPRGAACPRGGGAVRLQLRQQHGVPRA